MSDNQESSQPKSAAKGPMAMGMGMAKKMMSQMGGGSPFEMMQKMMSQMGQGEGKPPNVGIEFLDIDVELPGVGEDGMPGRNEQ